MSEITAQIEKKVTNDEIYFHFPGRNYLVRDKPKISGMN